jgi:hypothetical protein
MQRHWLIRGYDRTKLIFQMRVGLNQLSDKQMKDLLRTLTAKASLQFSEIVGAYAKRRTKIANDLLHVHQDTAQPTYMCGTNPHFVASVIDEDGKIVNFPTLK